MVIYFDSQHEMYCNEIRNKSVILIMLMIMTDIQIVATKQRHIQIPEQENNQIVMTSQLDEGTSGDLYNIFKKRLLVITNELAYHKFNDLQQQSTTVQEKRSENKDNTNLKQQKFNYSNLTDNQLVNSLNSKSKNGKRSYERWKFYNLYRMNNMKNNELSYGSEHIVDRSGRSFFNWFRKKSKDNNNAKNHFSPNPQHSEQLLNRTKVINDEDNGNFTKLLDILKKESNLTNFIASRDTLNQEFLKQMEIVNKAMTPLANRFYRQTINLNKHYNYYNQNWLQDEDNYDNIDWDFDNQSRDYEFWNLLPKKTTSLNHRKRQVFTNNANTNAVYPSVLTKALEISLSPSVHTNSSGSLLSKVAQKMNTSTLNLAEQLAKSTNSPNDGRLAKMVQNFMTNDHQSSNGGNIAELTNKLPATINNLVSSQTLAAQIPITTSYKPIIFQGPSTSSPVQTGTAENLQTYSTNVETSHELTSSSLTKILDRVLSKLESIHDGKNGDDELHPDGAPCDIIGSWSSVTLGLCFDIKLNKDKFRNVSPAEINNKLLIIDVLECTPQKTHTIVDLEWKFGGSALKTMGGPFYIYAQKRNESLVGTFLGYCRTSGNIDTIFGAWTFSSPSKSYYDISLAFDVKRDILRRDRMEMKRKERFKDLLYQSRIGNSRNR